MSCILQQAGHLIWRANWRRRIRVTDDYLQDRDREVDSGHLLASPWEDLHTPP